MNHAKGIFLCSGLIWLMSVPLASAEVTGTVFDIHHHPLAGIHVRIGESGRMVDTDEHGRFGFTINECEAPLQLTFESSRFHRQKMTLAMKNLPAHLNVFLIPIRLTKEDVTVTAMNEAEKGIAVPYAQSVVPAIAIKESQPETIVQSLQKSPGIHFIGKGGLSVTPSIRGLARRRVLFLVHGARITSDRSAGASAHFFPPEMASQIEVVRSAASVLYGSDALGGVLQIIPQDPDHLETGRVAFNLSGNSASRRVNGGFSLAHEFSGFSVMASAQAARADDYASPEERILNSGYNCYAGSLAVNYRNEKRGIRFYFLKSAGRDIGKPERANDPEIASFYPEENTNLLSIGYRENALIREGILDVSFFLNANDYELNKIGQAGSQIDIAKNSALDFGLRASIRKKLGRSLALQAGADYYGRTNVDMMNQTWEIGLLTGNSLPVENGRRNDLGAYAMLTAAMPAGYDLVGGARLGALSRSALSNGVFLKKSSLAPAFFFGITRRIKKSLTLFFNAGTAYRVPSLSESFYTGITGRSFISGNPDLVPEKSLNFDAGLKIHSKHLSLGAYVFQYSIRGMIEKFPLTNASYTYANIEQGRIRGLELEFQYLPFQKLEFFGNAFYYRGTGAASNGSLNDIPGAKLFLGMKFWLGRLWSELDWLASAAVNRPGPAEIAIPAFSVTDLKAGYYFSNRWFLYVKIANLFDRAYYANADPDIPLSKGFDLSLGLHFNL